jgi:hypothetical protein
MSCSQTSTSKATFKPALNWQEMRSSSSRNLKSSIRPAEQSLTGCERASCRAYGRRIAHEPVEPFPDRPVADRSPINHAHDAGPSQTNGPLRRPTADCPLPVDGGSDAKIHDFDGCGACPRSFCCCGHRADSIARRGPHACANSKCHADRQRCRLPRLWAVLSAGHDPALRTLPPLLVRPLLLTLGRAGLISNKRPPSTTRVSGRSRLR